MDMLYYKITDLLIAPREISLNRSPRWWVQKRDLRQEGLLRRRPCRPYRACLQHLAYLREQLRHPWPEGWAWQCPRETFASPRTPPSRQTCWSRATEESRRWQR